MANRVRYDTDLIIKAHRQRRARRVFEEERDWGRSESCWGHRQTSAAITDAIKADPKESDRLNRSRQQVREGDIRWGLEDDDSTNSDSE